MTRQTAGPLEHINLSASNRSARELANWVIAGDLDLNAPYQRGSVWTEDQRVSLIRSYLTGVPIPAVIINDRGTPGWRKANGSNPLDDGNYGYVCVDGKQRLEATAAWVAGDLAVPASWFAPELVAEAEDTDDGPYVRFTGLTPVGRRRFDREALIPSVEAHVETVQDEAAIYLLVNGGGTPQSDADMANAARVAQEGN